MKDLILEASGSFRFFPQHCDLSMFDLVGLESRVSRYQADVFLPRHKVSRQLIQEIVDSPEPPPRPKPVRMKVNRYSSIVHTFYTQQGKVELSQVSLGTQINMIAL